MSDQRNPSSSPRRAPVVAASRTKSMNTGSFSRNHSNTVITVSGGGTSCAIGPVANRVACDAGFDQIHSHRTACANTACTTPRTLFTVPAERVRPIAANSRSTCSVVIAPTGTRPSRGNRCTRTSERVCISVPADHTETFAAIHASSNVENGASAPNAGPDCITGTKFAKCPWTRRGHPMGTQMRRANKSGTLKRVPDLRLYLELKTGFEPATLTLANVRMTVQPVHELRLRTPASTFCPPNTPQSRQFVERSTYARLLLSAPPLGTC